MTNRRAQSLAAVAAAERVSQKCSPQLVNILFVLAKHLVNCELQCWKEIFRGFLHLNLISLSNAVRFGSSKIYGELIISIFWTANLNGEDGPVICCLTINGLFLLKYSELEINMS